MFSQAGPERGRPRRTSEEGHSYWISFSDIMSGLLVVFILACLALLTELMQTKNRVDQAISELSKAEEVKRSILQEIKATLKERHIEVQISDNESILRIPEQLLAFETNQFTIPDNDTMRRHLTDIGNVLYAALTKKNRMAFMDTIFIEGHTDRRPTSRQLGNWGLSSFRAISVWNYWNDEAAIPLRSLRNHGGKPLFSVSGYGKTRPLLAETASPLRINRRIDIRITVKKPIITDYTDVKSIF